MGAVVLGRDAAVAIQVCESQANCLALTAFAPLLLHLCLLFVTMVRSNLRLVLRKGRHKRISSVANEAKSLKQLSARADCFAVSHPAGARVGFAITERPNATAFDLVLEG